MKGARKHSGTARARVARTGSAAPQDALLRHFRGQRPLRAGSLLITLFGDAIAPRGGAITLGSLIRLGAPFGLNERLVRTSVARLAREDWLSARRHGRRSEYRLTQGGAARFAQATQRIYGKGPPDWDGQWTFLILSAGTPHAAGLRDNLRWLGFGQLSPTLFAHPGAGDEQISAVRALPGGARLLHLTARAPGAGGDERLVKTGWDLRELGQRYRRFVTLVSPLARGLACNPPAAETAFVIRTLLIHEYRKIHLQDPLLPPALLPRGWEGATAYAACADAYRRVFASAEDFLDRDAERLTGPLPAVQPAALARFG
ncbi:MAG: phenylacetic acid degradation operon negative regulatory protein PaaX [Proteobacteria bacterium]|nr:phenylacetic acid degradation operon negative regulatory protein PaaX [Pseudomonadota bacterium]